jgi:hypothetical protein
MSQAVTVTVPEDPFLTLVSKAILDSLTDEVKNGIIAQAIAYINKPQGDSWRSERSTPLQDAFNMAVNRLVNTLADEVIRESEHFQQVRAEMKEQIDRYPTVATDYELQAKIATTIMEHAQRQVR